MATWIASAMLALPVLPGGPCTCSASSPSTAPGQCARDAHVATSGTCCCAHGSPADSAHKGTCGASCHCNHASAPAPPAVPAGQAHSAADQLLVLQAASAPLPRDAAFATPFGAPSHDGLLAAGSALDRCVLLSRLIL